MEVVLSIPEVELEDFPEEATESSGQQIQPSESSQTQGTVKSLLSIKLFPMAELLEKIRQGRLSYLDLDGATPKAKGGSTKDKITKQHTNSYRKRPWSLVIDKPIKACKRPGHSDIR